VSKITKLTNIKNATYQMENKNKSRCDDNKY